MRLTNSPSNAGQTPNDPQDANLRKRGRIRLQDIECSLGIVLDLSASGMRVRTRGRVPETGTVFATQLGSLDGPIVVGCRVRWWRKAGLMTKEFGVEFVNLTPEIAVELTRLARRAVHNETFQREIEEGRCRL